MQVERLGDGAPELAVVGGVHGDEPAGVRAIKRLLADAPEVRRPIEFVIANEEALAADRRYVDADLNRSFPGDATADAHERRLAAELTEHLSDRPVLDLHSTRSRPTPFAIVHGTDDRTRALAAATGVEHVVDAAPISDGGLVSTIGGVVVEVGPAGSERATDQADRVLRTFLVNRGVLEPVTAFEDEPVPDPDPVLYRMHDVVEGADYEVPVENFERVDEGEVFARRDGDQLRADDPFWPVLMSTDGYDDLVGFTARKVGPLADAGNDEQ